MKNDDQIILAVDDDGKFHGEYIPKWEGHTGAGKRHLAITVQLENSKGELLLQKRKHRVFDDIWDMTGATHPLHLAEGKDETVEEASWRCLEVEYGIKEKIPLKNYGFFNYFAEYGDLCEHEHCAILVGKYDEEFKLNDEVGYGYKWMSKAEFLKDIKKNPKSYSPWAIEAAKLLEENGFFD